LASLKPAIIVVAQNQLEIITKLKGRNPQFMKVSKWSEKQRALEDVIEQLEGDKC